MAVTFAERQSTGTSPSTKVLLKISVRIGADSSAKSFKIRAGIMSDYNYYTSIIIKVNASSFEWCMACLSKMSLDNVTR